MTTNTPDPNPENHPEEPPSGSPAESQPGIMDLLDDAGTTSPSDTEEDSAVTLPGNSYEVAVGGSLWDFLQRASWPEQSLGQEEDVLVAQNPSRWRAAPVWAVGLTMIGASAILTVVHLFGFTPDLLTAIFPFMNVTTVPAGYGLLVLLPGLFGFMMVAGEMVTRAFTWNVVTDIQVFVRTRILSKKVQDVSLQEISKLDLVTPFPLRIVGVGHIYVYTPGTDGAELELTYLRNPEKVKAAIKGRAPNLADP